MPDIQSLHLALGAMPQKERDEFLGAALSQQPVASLENILQRLALEELAVNTKVRLVFKMGLSPVAHAFKAGPERQLNWVVPVVPDHLRPLVYSTSRLINEFQETLTCLQNGRGDFVKAFTLLNPETMLEMVNRFSDEMQTYTQQLRDANGRFNRTGAQRPRRNAAPRPTVPQATPANDAGNIPDRQGPTVEKSPVPTTEDGQTERKTASRRAKSPKTTEAESVGSGSAGAMSKAPDSVSSETVPADFEQQSSCTIGEDSPIPGQPEFSSDNKSQGLSAEELATFGFDVTAVAADSGTTRSLEEDGE